MLSHDAGSVCFVKAMEVRRLTPFNPSELAAMLEEDDG